MTYSPMKDLLEDVARRAGDFLLERFRQDTGLVELRSSAKEAATAYDRMADELIIRRIKDEYPEHGLLTEESGSLMGDPDWLWIVDSLDGTGNFANWNPLFAVCIALMHQTELVLGSVYAPAIDEFYVAEKGKGAYLNGRRVRVSDASALARSYVFYCEGGERDRERTGTLLEGVYPEVVDIRKLGSAGLETAWVAAGRGEAYYTTSIDPWDVAPGVLLVMEAGGRVSDLEGDRWEPVKSDLLFSNGMVHDHMLGLLQASRTASPGMGGSGV